MKEPNSVHRILDETGTILASNIPGEVGERKADLQVNSRTEPEQEKLLPTDRQSGQKDKKKTPQRKRNSGEEALYPLNTIKND